MRILLGARVCIALVILIIVFTKTPVFGYTFEDVIEIMKVVEEMRRQRMKGVGMGV
jgi:hypothetical protein